VYPVISLIPNANKDKIFSLAGKSLLRVRKEVETKYWLNDWKSRVYAEDDRLHGKGKTRT